MRFLDGESALRWLNTHASRLSTCIEVRLGVAPDLVALAMLIYGDEGSTHLSELTVSDTVDYAKALLELAGKDNDCQRRGLFLAWLVQDAIALAELEPYKWTIEKESATTTFGGKLFEGAAI